jgi:hypothetical protein
MQATRIWNSWTMNLWSVAMVLTPHIKRGAVSLSRTQGMLLMLCWPSHCCRTHLSKPKADKLSLLSSSMDEHTYFPERLLFPLEDTICDYSSQFVVVVIVVLLHSKHYDPLQHTLSISSFMYIYICMVLRVCADQPGVRETRWCLFILVKYIAVLTYSGHVPGLIAKNTLYYACHWSISAHLWRQG